MHAAGAVSAPTPDKSGHLGQSLQLEVMKAQVDFRPVRAESPGISLLRTDQICTCPFSFSLPLD